MFQDTGNPLDMYGTDGDFVDESEYSHVPFHPRRQEEDEMIRSSQRFYQSMNQRRSCRMISDEQVPREVIDNIVHTAGM